MRKCINRIQITDGNPTRKDLYFRIRDILKDLGVEGEISGVSQEGITQ